LDQLSDLEGGGRMLPNETAFNRLCNITSHKTQLSEVTTARAPHPKKKATEVKYMAMKQHWT
jgi:hypothetical protein